MFKQDVNLKSMFRKLSLICSLGAASSCADTQSSPAAVVPEGVWLDVRTAAEYASWHVPGSLHLPFDRISKEHPMVQEGTLPKDQTLLVYCRSGRRSGIAKQSLESLGYTVVNVGGLREAKTLVDAQRATSDTGSGEGTQSPDSTR